MPAIAARLNLRVPPAPTRLTGVGKHGRARYLAVLLAFGALISAAPALADAALDAHRLQLQLPPPLPAEFQQNHTATPLKVATSLPSIVITQIRIRGTTVYLESKLTLLVTDYVGKKQDLQSLEQAAATISAYYRKHGYVLARAWLPEQSLDDGVLEIRVNEGLTGSNAPEQPQEAPLDDAWLQARLGAFESSSPPMPEITPRKRLAVTANSGQGSNLNLNYIRAPSAGGSTAAPANAAPGATPDPRSSNPDSVRTYTAGDSTADNVWIFDLGLRYDLAQALSLVTFYDVARSNRRQIDPSGSHRSLAGAGFGFEWQLGEGDLISVTAAWRSSAQAATDADQAPRIDLYLRKSF